LLELLELLLELLELLDLLGLLELRDFLRDDDGGGGALRLIEFFLPGIFCECLFLKFQTRPFFPFPN